MKIILKDKTVFEVEETSLATKLIAKFNSVEELEQARTALSDENLEEFCFLNNDEQTIGKYAGYTCIDTSYTEEENVYIATFTLRELSDLEKRVSKLETTQEEQDEALVELAEMVTE